MADAPRSYAGRRDDADDGWGPSTSVRAAGGASPSRGRLSGRGVETAAAEGARQSATAGVAAAKPNGAAYTASGGAAGGARRPAPASHADEQAHSTTRTRKRGLPGWAALLVLVAIAAIGGLIDMLRGTHVRGAFNIAIVVAALVAIVVVRRSSMFTVVVAPPIVYTAASLGTVYIRSGGLKDRKVLFDAAANWLVYGFPAIAAATAAVLIVAGVRLIIRR